MCFCLRATSYQNCRCAGVHGIHVCTRSPLSCYDNLLLGLLTLPDWESSSEPPLPAFSGHMMSCWGREGFTVHVLGQASGPTKYPIIYHKILLQLLWCPGCALCVCACERARACVPACLCRRQSRRSLWVGVGRAGLLLSWLASGTKERLLCVWHWLAACVQTAPLGWGTMGVLFCALHPARSSRL